MNLNLQNHIQKNLDKTIRTRIKREKVLKLIADDSEDGNKMKVLIDGDGMKLLMDVWSDYVSDDEFENFPKFMKDVDSLLLGFRGGKPLTREERQEMNEVAPTTRRAKKKKKKAAAVKKEVADTDGNTEGGTITSSDIVKRAKHFSGYLSGGMTLFNK